MQIASITEAKNRLSALLDVVRGGETVLIVDRGRPVARLEPAAASTGDSDGRLARLERSGLVRRGRGHSSARILESPPRPEETASALDALLREREDGR